MKSFPAFRSTLVDARSHRTAHWDLWRSRWFSHELTRESWPWVYEKSDTVAAHIHAGGARSPVQSYALL